MPIFLADLGAALGGQAVKWGLFLVLILASGGGGFVWGETRATALAAQASVKDADIRVAAAQKSDQALLTDYLARLSAQTARGNALGAALAADEAKLSSATRVAQETMSHAVPANSACDIPSAALALLRAQPARR